MRRKILVYSLRIAASILLLLSVLSALAVRLSDKGDIVDRNSGWILLAFVLTSAIFIYSLSISDGARKRIDRSKTTDELISEIRKSSGDPVK